MDSYTDRHSSEPTVATAAATWASLLEASSNSESDDLAAAAAISIDADDGDAESCSGDDGSEELDIVSKRLVSWECWMMESDSVVVVGAGCPPLSMEDTRDTEGDRLFWEACIAHGY